MKIIHVIVLFLTIPMLSACNAGQNPQENLPEIYSLALDSFMKQDKGLNNDMEFIAIDMDSLKQLSEDGKKEVADFFKETYQVDVIDATFEELKEQGLFNPETMSLDGVLLQVEEVDFTFTNDAVVSGSKFKSGLGAIYVESIIHFKDGEWQVKDTKITAIS